MLKCATGLTLRQGGTTGEMDNPFQSLAKAFLFRIEGTRLLSLVRDNRRCIRCRTHDERSFQASLAVFSPQGKRPYSDGGSRILQLQRIPPGGASFVLSSSSGISLQVPTLG